MRDVLLLSAVMIYFVLGYFLMKRIDRFLEENERRKYGDFSEKRDKKHYLQKNVRKMLS